MKKVFIITVLAIFVVLTGVFFWLKSFAPEYNFNVLIIGNIIMAALTFISFILVQKQVGDKPDAFVRGVYSSSFLKLMVCMFAVLIYAYLNRGNIHKPSMFVLFGVYAVYSTAETWLLSKMARVRKQG